MVTPMTLQDALNDFLESHIATKFKLKSDDNKGEEFSELPSTHSMTHPKIVRSGWVLPDSIDDDESEGAFPYILTRIDKVEHVGNARAGIVTMMIGLGIYAPCDYDGDGKTIDDGSGYRDFWNVIESIRQALFRQSILDNKYKIADDFFEAEMLGEQIYPYWEGFCLTKWHIPFLYPE